MLACVSSMGMGVLLVCFFIWIMLILAHRWQAPWLQISCPPGPCVALTLSFLSSGAHALALLSLQGFEIYGALRMGLSEDEAEDFVNPSGLTEEEEGLLEGHQDLEVKKKLSWDPKVLMERERQREYKVSHRLFLPKLLLMSGWSGSLSKAST